MDAADTRLSALKGLTNAAGDLEARLLLNSNRFMPALQMCLIALGAAFFIQWWALAWCAPMLALLVVRGNPKVQTKVPDGIAGAIAIFGGSVLYASILAGAWFAGGAEANFLAAALICTQAVYASTFFAGSRLNFWANLSPVILIAVVAPFFVFDHPIPVLVVFFAVAQNVVSALISRSNRNGMLEAALRIQSEMEAARNESLAKSQFLATMSHELRTPLNAVIGYAELLEEELAEDGRTDNAVDAARIHRSARSLLTLINEVLDFSKIEAGRMEVHVDRVEIDALINEVVQTIEHITSARGTEVCVDVAADARIACTDAQRLRQCVLNLMSNAAKFTEGGRIDVRATAEHDGLDEFLRIDVRDTGCGIAESDAARLFQPFTQVDGSLTRRTDGTGLGLMITKRLGELLGGGVSFVSAKGKGSTFTLRVRDHSQRETAVKGDGPVVLVIEDESSARDLLRRMLAHLPIEITEARTATEGIAAAHARTPQLIVLDIHLPDRSGWDVLAEFKADEALGGVPVLVVSTDDDRARALRLGACEHLVKPVDKERVASAVLRFALGDAVCVAPRQETAAA